MMSSTDSSRRSASCGSPRHQTLDVLENRLCSVEGDAKKLSQQLKQMGFEPDQLKDRKQVRFSDSTKRLQAGYDPIAPFKAQVPDVEVLHKNYDKLVSRVCHMESTIQGLKLNITKAQAERDLREKEKTAVNDKFTIAKEAYEKEIVRLDRELAQSKKHAAAQEQERSQAEQHVRKLQQALEETTNIQSTTSLDVGELKSVKAKLQRRINELKDELTRETSLRKSLEESHNTLLGRIEQQENIVDTAREEVQKMSTTCNQMKRETIQAKAEYQHEHEIRLNGENELSSIHAELEKRHKKIQSLEEDKKILTDEIKKIQKQYYELNGHIENLTKVMSDKQGTYKQLEHENKHLFEAMQSAATQNADLIAKYEQELETGLIEKAVKLQTEENMKQVEDRLRAETRAKVQAETKCEEMDQQISELKKKLNKLEKSKNSSQVALDKKLQTLTEKLKNAEEENTNLLKNKEELLDEVNQAVDSMTEERGQLEEQLQKLRVEIQNLEQRNKHSVEENYRLLQRLAALEEQQSSQKHVDQAMTDMMEQKNKLAYEKGRLQSKVEQLQKELESLANAQIDLTQTRRSNTALENKITQLQEELSCALSQVQKLETQLKQVRGSSERKGVDYEMAIKARDDAVKEVNALHQKIDQLLEKEKQRAAAFEQSLLDVRNDNKKMAVTLESVMQSHTKLQLTIEGLQIDLGRKDNNIVQLKQDKNKFEQLYQELRREADQIQDKMMTMNDLETNQVSPLRNALKEAQNDNRQLAQNMEALIDSNSQLHAALEQLKDQLVQKTHFIEKLQESREQTESQHKNEIQMYEERLENMNQQLGKEKEKSVKKSTKEISEVRKQLELMLSKNGELSRANTDLRHKLTETEHLVKEQKNKMVSFKAQIDHLQRMRSKQEQTIESLQGLSSQLNDLEKTKNEYMKKTKEQAKTIQNFMMEISELQTELKTLAKTQLDMSSLVQTQEKELKKQMKMTQHLRAKYMQSQHRQQHLENLRQQTEDKLKEANNESIQISTNLHDAHEWFKSKFDHLQHELQCAKEPTRELDEQLETQHLLVDDDRTQADMTAKRATEMMKTSRETISRLAGFAEIAQNKTQKELQAIQKQLLDERKRAEESERKLKQFQDASLRHTEELARELAYVKNHSWVTTES